MRLTTIKLVRLTLLTFAAAIPCTGLYATEGPAAREWQIAPPSPVFSDAERVAELSRRRAELSTRIGEKGMLVLFSAEPRLYTNDVNFPYRQENNFYYLTGINNEGATLVLIPAGKSIREILFIPKRDPLFETWNGRMLSTEGARRISGIQEVWDADQFRSFMTSLSPRSAVAFGPAGSQRGPGGPAQVNKAWLEEFKGYADLVALDDAVLYLLLPTSGASESAEYRQEQRFAAKLPPGVTGMAIRSGMKFFAEMRQRKSDYEMKLMQQAVDISIEAFNRAFATARPGVHEYEVQAEFEYTYRKRNAFNWGYPCIVGADSNAAFLHYITNQDALSNNGLLLMDCAAEFDHYSADITRTIPINGRFSREQADIYQIVFEAQTEAIKLVRAGGTITAMHNRSAEVIKDGLLRLGLITSKDNNEFRTWFMHGTGHWLGMNVHDVGTTPNLAPGMVLTVEPGIYLRPDALDVLPKTPENLKFIEAVRPGFEKYKGIGVRIEDDVLVTTGEPRVLSSALPRRLDEVEALIARLRMQASKTGLP